MDVERSLVHEFEAGLNPQDLDASKIPVEVLGYGEISIILQIGDNAGVAFKRMPLFSNLAAAEQYERQFHEYCGYLRDAGLSLPDHETMVITIPGRPVVLYIAQERFPGEYFSHRLVHGLEPGEAAGLLDRIIEETDKVWKLNDSSHSVLQLAIDAQVSNWVCLENGKILYIDTSTPLYRKDGVEQMDPELFLQSAPAFLRWLIRWLFLKDVMNRYYDPRLVFIDLAANLYKEKCPELIPDVIRCINRHLPPDQQPLSMEEVKKYYKEDKLIWTLFLAFRRIDRWMTTKLFRRRYEFLLPGRIER